MHKKSSSVRLHKGLAKKPAAPSGTMQMVDGKAMIQSRPPKKKGKR